MVHQTKVYSFINSFIGFIDNCPFFESGDIQNTFIMNFKNSNIHLIITPKNIKKSQKYNINNIKKIKYTYTFEIDSNSSEDNEVDNSFSDSYKEIELLNNNKNIFKVNNLNERNLIETKEYWNKNIYSSLYNNKSLYQQEESKGNSNLLIKAKSSQKTNLKFGKAIEHIEIENRKSKENNEEYKNPLEIIEEKNDTDIKPKGLYNFSLNNYMNSLLQCLFHIKELREYFIKKKNEFTDDQPVCKAFAEVMNELKNSNNNYVEPKRFKKLMGNTNNLFYGCKNGDVKDFFIYLIDSVLTELNKDNNNDENEESINIDFSDKKEVFEEIFQDINKKKNIINKIFIGYYETIYKCSKYDINTYSMQTESFLLFDLEKIKKYFKQNKLSIELCFKYYYREQLESEFYCNKCHKIDKGNAYEKMYRPPKILLIILDRGHGKTFKEEVKINIYLDLKDFIDEDEYEYSSLYKLICVSTHSGESSARGYYSACCLADNNKYYYFRDTYVKEIDEKNVIKDDPYLLFYEQINDKKEINRTKKENKETQIREKSKNYNYITPNISKESEDFNHDKVHKDKLKTKEDSNKNISQSLNNDKSLYEQEESKNNYNLNKKAKSSQKTNLQFGKKIIGHIEIESKKTKENNERYYNNQLGVIEEKNDNEIKPKGLYNFGLNCYMNSLLQCLFYIKELREYFIKNQNKFTEKQPICKAFAEVMDKLKNSQNDYVEPKEFKKLMGNINNLFKGIKAGDVKDLFFNLIDTFLTELDKEINYEESENNDIDYSNKKQMFKETLKEIDQHNIINIIFIGYYETNYKCLKHNKNVDTYSFQTESFLLFELEKIKNYFKQNKLSIESGFKYYYREQLNTEFYCSECKVVHKGKAYEKIYRPPKILVIVLDRGHGKTFKGDVEINKYLDITNIIDEDEFKYSSLYKLICISTHKGTSSSSGHYTACCLAENNKYYYFSDTYVHEIDEKYLFNDEPYLLFYKQIDINKENNNEINKIRKETKIIEVNKKNIQNNNFISNNNNNFKLYQDFNNQNENKKQNYRDILNQKSKQNNTSNFSDKKKSNENNIRTVKDHTNEKERLLSKNEDKNNLYSTKNNYSKYKTYKIDYLEIQSALKQFKRNSNKYYEVDYYYTKNNYPYVWKLKIKGQINTPYYGKILNFKLDFSKPFNKLTDSDNIKLENKIYHINFGENGLLLFNIEYKENKSFYDNLKELFNLLCNLFIEPNCDLSMKYSRAKINLYKNNREEYNKKVRESLYK